MKIMHDEEIADTLLKELDEEFGTYAIDLFCNCLSDLFVPLEPKNISVETNQKMVARINHALESVGSSIRVNSFQGCNNYGYFWEVVE